MVAASMHPCICTCIYAKACARTHIRHTNEYILVLQGDRYCFEYLFKRSQELSYC